jgi:hypothetical protein
MERGGHILKRVKKTKSQNKAMAKAAEKGEAVFNTPNVE